MDAENLNKLKEGSESRANQGSYRTQWYCMDAHNVFQVVGRFKYVLYAIL